MHVLTFVNSRENEKEDVFRLCFQPENVLLDLTENCIKLIDFGSAEDVETIPVGEKRKSKRSIGEESRDTSPEFLPPEIISCGPVGTFTDMWEFGVLLYVVLR